MKIKRITIILILVFLVSVFIIINGYIASMIGETEILDDSETEDIADLKENGNNIIKGERYSHFF